MSNIKTEIEWFDAKQSKPKDFQYVIFKPKNDIVMLGTYQYDTDGNFWGVFASNRWHDDDCKHFGDDEVTHWAEWPTGPEVSA